MSGRKLPTWAIATTAALLGGLLVGGALYAAGRSQDRADDRRIESLEKQLSDARDAEKDEQSDGGDEGSIPTPTPAPETPEPQPPAADDPATPLPSSEFAFVKQVTYGDPGSIVLDYAEFLTGSEAAKAAKAHGDESPPPNDYYIVNDNTKLRTFKLSADAKVRLTTSPDGTSDPAGYTATTEQWANHFAAPGDENASIRSAGYWFVIKDGTVTEIREQFVP